MVAGLIYIIHVVNRRSLFNKQRLWIILKTCFVTRLCLQLADVLKRRGVHRYPAFSLSSGWFRGNQCLFKLWAIIHLQWISFNSCNENSVCSIDSSHHFVFLTFFFSHVYCLIFLKVILVYFPHILFIRVRENKLPQKTSLSVLVLFNILFFCFLNN